jgi:hypothetical protein
MDKTIISHFYNEEYLLPWWLNHHKNFFDHGILINYNSTDNSCNIIKNICPHWHIINTKNMYFDSADIDLEIQTIEHSIRGWKICLNTTEFLVGDYNIINHEKSSQILIGNYVFVDTDTKILDHNTPLYNQIINGFHQNINACNIGLGDRPLRSMHNCNLRYPPQGGRHFFGRETSQDLFIFYYAYLLGIDEIIKRKTQIQSKMSNREIAQLKKYTAHPNIVTEDSFISKIKKYQLPKCQDMSLEINRLISLQNKCLNKNVS